MQQQIRSVQVNSLSKGKADSQHAHYYLDEDGHGDGWETKENQDYVISLRSV